MENKLMYEQRYLALAVNTIFWFKKLIFSIESYPSECQVTWRIQFTVFVWNDFHFSVFDYTYIGIGCAQMNTDCILVLKNGFSMQVLSVDL